MHIPAEVSCRMYQANVKNDHLFREAPLSPVRQAWLMRVVIAPLAACYPPIKAGLDIAPSLAVRGQHARGELAISRIQSHRVLFGGHTTQSKTIRPRASLVFHILGIDRAMHRDIPSAVARPNQLPVRTIPLLTHGSPLPHGAIASAGAQFRHWSPCGMSWNRFPSLPQAACQHQTMA